MWTHYVVMDFWSENIWTVLTIYTSHTHEIFNFIFWNVSYRDLILFFENVSYRDLIFDRWEKTNIDLKFSLQKL
jgi:hypothetical protein